MLGIRTLDRRMEGADEATELWLIEAILGDSESDRSPIIEIERLVCRV